MSGVPEREERFLGQSFATRWAWRSLAHPPVSRNKGRRPDPQEARGRWDSCTHFTPKTTGKRLSLCTLEKSGLNMCSPRHQREKRFLTSHPSETGISYCLNSAALGPPGFAETRILGGPWPRTAATIPRKRPPERERKNEICDGRGKKARGLREGLPLNRCRRQHAISREQQTGKQSSFSEAVFGWEVCLGKL